RVRVGEDGRESVVCHRGDGWALARLKEAGVRLLILTCETNPVVRRRAEKLKIECIQSSEGKLEPLMEWCRRHGVDPKACVYVGNDVPDVPCMRYVACGVAPSDAYQPAINAARIVLETSGGAGCIRELAELISESRIFSREDALG